MDSLKEDIFDWFVIILSIEHTLGMIMNGIILSSILRTTKLRNKPFYVIVAGLCLSETFGGIATPLRLVTNFANDIPYRKFCIIYESVFLLVVLLNNYNLLVISCERICALSFPIFYKTHITVRKVVCFVAVSWLLFCGVIAGIMIFG